MADSDAVRQQRRRRHQAGDHTMCRRGCKDSRASVTIAKVPTGSGRDIDPSLALRDLAVGLQAAYRADPGNGLLARELRMTLLALRPSREAGVDDELAALMRDLARPVPASETEPWFQAGQSDDFG
jgi:hypothetical protein